MQFASSDNLLPHLFAYFSQSEDEKYARNNLNYFDFLHAPVRGDRVSWQPALSDSTKSGTF
jgi:hypothetical protein